MYVLGFLVLSVVAVDRCGNAYPGYESCNSAILNTSTNSSSVLDMFDIQVKCDDLVTAPSGGDVLLRFVSSSYEETRLEYYQTVC